MILTGAKIVEEVRRGAITLSPFSPSAVNPNSYNYRLGPELKVFAGHDGERACWDDLTLPEQGWVLEPDTTYLGHTLEVIGSDRYAMSLIGRSSLGRYGLFLQISANLGHTQSCHSWTLELHAVQPIRIYPGMTIGQVSFWANQGPLRAFPRTYADFNEPHESLLGCQGAHDDPHRP